MIKILFVGDSWSPQYVKAFYESADSMDDVNADIFDNREYWENTSIVFRLEKHFRKGILLSALNKQLIAQCRDTHYDLVFLYGASLIFSSTVKHLKELGPKVFIYCNDCPFSTWYRPYAWDNLKKSLKYADIVYSYRESDVDNYRIHGAKVVKILRSYYMKNRNFFIPDESIDLNVPSVVYIGHYENDGRADYIKALLDEGIDVGVNYSWPDLGWNTDHLIRFDKQTSMGRYNELLNKAQIAIVFLSSINNDTYTRRCFEIPAVKTLMIAPNTSDIASMYDDKKEAVLFDDIDGFVEQVKYYLSNEDERLSICNAGYERLINDGNEVDDRVRSVLEDYFSLQNVTNDLGEDN